MALIVASQLLGFCPMTPLSKDTEMISSADIEKAKAETRYSTRGDILHEHDDCIRIAYEWLDAQAKTKGSTRTTWPLKHLIERWGGRYVSQSDVEVAAHLHPQITGKYPHYNISSKLTKPAEDRLSGIAEARTQDYTERDPKVYSRSEHR